MKRFTLLSIGILCLALSALVGFHVGNRTVQAQTTETVFLTSQYANGNGYTVIAILPNGDVYERECRNYDPFDPTKPALFFGNFWDDNPPVPTSSDKNK